MVVRISSSLRDYIIYCIIIIFSLWTASVFAEKNANRGSKAQLSITFIQADKKNTPYLYHVEVTNLSNRDLEINIRDTFLEGLSSPRAIDLLDKHGHAVLYQGMTYEPLPDSEPPFITIQTGETINGIIDFTDGFILNKNQSYTITVPDRFASNTGKKISIDVEGDLTFVSNATTSHPKNKVNAGNLGLHKPNQPSMPTCEQIDSNNNTPFADQNITAEMFRVHEYLVTIVTDAHENFFGGKCYDQAYFERWFGPHTPEKYERIKSNINALYENFTKGKYQTVCTDDASWCAGFAKFEGRCDPPKDSACNNGAGAWSWISGGGLENNPSYYCFKYNTPEGVVYRNSFEFYPPVENLAYVTDIEERSDNGRAAVRGNLPYVILHENGHAMANLRDRTYDPTVALQWALSDDVQILDNNNTHVFFLLEKYINGNQGFCH